jgi:hypothetical protein
MNTFTAQVSDWVMQTKSRMNAVFKESTQRTVELMQTPVAKGGNMPVDTGFLRNSLMGGLNAPKDGRGDNPGVPVSYNDADIVLTIANAELGDTIFMTYSANYARHVEYGARGRAGRGFVRLATQRWQSTVSQVALEAQQRTVR